MISIKSFSSLSGRGFRVRPATRSFGSRLCKFIEIADYLTALIQFSISDTRSANFT